jgi:xanthine dehydrogenase YagT iron-sulfur-binding subunit
VSSKNDSERTRKPANAVSRRGFLGGVGLGGVGLGGGALGTGLLERDASAAQPVKVVGPGEVPITLNINGKPVNLKVEPRVTLCDALRNRLDITGAKRVCDRGTCGACTVMLGGKTVYSCSVLAIDAQGRNIETIEGIGSPEKLHPISAAFWNNDAQQCGYCTPGFVMACKGFLEEHPNPTVEEFKRGLGGNLCRCGTYMGIKAAVMEVAKTATTSAGGKTNG